MFRVTINVSTDIIPIFGSNGKKAKESSVKTKITVASK
jgi:hypothetical protein